MTALRLIRDIAFSIIETVVTPVPGGLGRRLRYGYYACRLKRLGKGTIFDQGVRILNPEHVTIGDNCWICDNVIVLAGPPGGNRGSITRTPNAAFAFSEGEVVIGNNCQIAIGVVLQGHAGLSIGDNVGIASGCLLYSMSHHHSGFDGEAEGVLYKFSSMAPPHEQSLYMSPIVLERNSALGLNSVVLPGGSIGEASWVASASVVTKSIPRYSIASGNPAKVFGPRRGPGDGYDPK